MELTLALSSQLCVSGLHWAFSAKEWSLTLRFWRKHGVKLIVVSENTEETVLCQQYTEYSEKKQNYVSSANKANAAFLRKREVNGAFCQKHGVK